MTDLFELRPVPDKGHGLVARTDLRPGTLLIEEEPLITLDPPCKRNELLKALGCQYAYINMRATPDEIRTQIYKVLLEKLVKKLPESTRQLFNSFSDKTSHRNGGLKSTWGIWQTNCLPLGSYRATGVFRIISRINHSCKPNAYHVWNEESGTEQIWIMNPIRAGEEIMISYIRTFCSKEFRQSLLNERFGFTCRCEACSLEGRELEKDDRLRTEIDRLAQQFALARQGDDPLGAIAIGEQILILMDEVGFNPSVQWPGFFNCFELYLQTGNVQKAKYYLDRSYELVCLAKGAESKDARTILKYKNCPEQYLEDFKTSEQHFSATLTHC